MIYYYIHKKEKDDILKKIEIQKNNKLKQLNLINAENETQKIEIKINIRKKNQTIKIINENESLLIDNILLFVNGKEVKNKY